MKSFRKRSKNKSLHMCMYTKSTISLQTELKNTFAWTSKHSVISSQQGRDRDWILFPRGREIRFTSVAKLAADLRRFMENPRRKRCLLFAASVNNPPMMYLSRKFQWKYRETSIQFRPRWLAISIYALRRYEAKVSPSCSVIDHLFSTG